MAMTELAEQVKRMGNGVLLLFPRESDATDDARKRGLDCVVVKSYEWLAPLDRKESLRERIRWALKHLWNRIAIRQIAVLIEKEHIDIVHINSLWGYVGAVAARRTGRPYVWHMRELLEQQGKKMRWPGSSERLVGGADALIAISKLVEENYKDRFLSGKLHLVYDGVDTEKMYRPGHVLFRQMPVQIITAGGIRPHKRQLDVVKAVEILRGQGIYVELSIVGDDDTPYAQTVRTYVQKHGLGKCVAFRGRQSDMAAWWAKSDIAVTASQFEAFGRVTAEAMLAGCVAVVSNSGANEEIVTDGVTGYVFQLGAPAALAAAIGRILDDKGKAAECAASARKSVAARFRSDNNARQVVELYQSILENRSRTGRGGVLKQCGRGMGNTSLS